MNVSAQKPSLLLLAFSHLVFSPQESPRASALKIDHWFSSSIKLLTSALAARRSRPDLNRQLRLDSGYRRLWEESWCFTSVRGFFILPPTVGNIQANMGEELACSQRSSQRTKMLTRQIRYFQENHSFLLFIYCSFEEFAHLCLSLQICYEFVPLKYQLCPVLHLPPPPL